MDKFAASKCLHFCTIRAECLYVTVLDYWLVASITAKGLAMERNVDSVMQFAENQGSYGEFNHHINSVSYSTANISLPAKHPCPLPCHAPSACSETEPCHESIIITCPCGRIRQSIPCGRSSSNPSGREGSQQLKCTPECAVAKRNARLAEALGINADTRNDGRQQISYRDDIIAFAKGDPKFCALVEKAFAE